MHRKKHHTAAKEGDTATDAEVRAAAGEPAGDEKAKATEPWVEDTRSRGALGIDQVRKGFEVRWVRQDAIDRRKMQGYKLADPKEYDLQADENGIVRRNELVLMEIPTELYEQRRETINAQTDLQSRAAVKEFEQDRAQMSRKTGSNLSDEDRESEKE